MKIFQFCHHYVIYMNEKDGIRQSINISQKLPAIAISYLFLLMLPFILIPALTKKFFI